MTVQSPPGAQPPPPPPQQPPPPAPKKGLGPLGWIAIGCGVIVIIVFIVMAGGAYLFKTKVVDPFKKNPGMATAKLIVQANPDLDLVSEDDSAHTLTIHNKKTNETVTLGMDDIKNGKLKFSTEGKGSASFDFGKQGATIKVQDEKGQESTIVAGAAAPKDLPAWLPVYPGASVEGGLSTKSAESTSQTFALTTNDPVDRVLAFYQDKLKDNGLTVQPSTTIAMGGQTSTGIVIADSTDKKRHVQVAISAADNQTKATISYEEKH
jgi:hypothetical protein